MKDCNKLNKELTLKRLNYIEFCHHLSLIYWQTLLAIPHKNGKNSQWMFPTTYYCVINSFKHVLDSIFPTFSSLLFDFYCPIYLTKRIIWDDTNVNIMFTEAICVCNHTIHPCVGKKFVQVMRRSVSGLIWYHAPDICNVPSYNYNPANSTCIDFCLCEFRTSSPKGNDAHLRATIQSEKNWKHQFFRRLRTTTSVVCGWIWLNFKLIQALMYVVITCKYEKDAIKFNREKVATPFFKL